MVQNTWEPDASRVTTEGESRNRRAAAAKPCRSATVTNAVIA